MSGKNIIFDVKKISKSNFYKNKKVFNTYNIYVSKILISKKEPYGKKKAHVNTLLDIMMMITTDIMESYGDVSTNFAGKKMPKENASYKCLSLIVLDSVMRVSRKYYPQTLLEECKYEMEKTKIESY